MTGGRLVMTPKIQGLGRSLVLQLHMVLKTMKIHDPSNKALLIATENLKDTINTLWAALDGSVRLQFVEGVVYLNDLRVRLDSIAREQIEYLQGEFDARGLGGLAFARPVDTAALRDFLVVFARPIESEEDVAAVKRSLQEMKELALELLGPKTFGDGEREDQELRIDRKTFALQTYAKSIIAVREFVQTVKAGEDPLVGRLPIVRIVQDLVDIATERVNFLLKMASIKSAHEYAFNHAANTCVVALVVGKALGIDRLELVDLGSAALLADVGFAMLPSEMLDKEIELTDRERLDLHEGMMRQIQSLIGKGKVNNALIRRLIVAFEHHLPYRDPATGAVGRTHIFSRIVGVADAFDALTTRRPWREGYAPDEALRILVGESDTKFDPLVVRVLVNLMGLYPLGTALRLASGELAVVYHNSNSPELFEKPWVKILKDPSGEWVKRTMIRNLAETAGPEGEVVEVARPADLEGLDPGTAIVM